MNLRKSVYYSPFLLFALPYAASQTTSSVAASALTAVPPLVLYSGAVGRANDQPLGGQASVTFLIYKDERGGEPLFTESQTVALDSAGHYEVQLGATSPNGLPSDLFATGEARWLEVQVPGETPKPRSLLVSVPYAMKAADAATLGGLPASAFALAGTTPPISPSNSNAITPDAASNVTTTGGTNFYLPKFNAATTVVDSEIYDTGTSVGIGGIPNSSVKLDVNGAMIMRGNMQVTRTGNATASTAYPSFGFQFYSNAYNSSTKTNDNPLFQLQSEPIGNNTASPSATFNLLFSNNGSAPAETGFSINPNGTVNFASGQTFPGTGAGTITGVTAGTGLTGGGSSGNVTLNLDTTQVPLLAASNNFTGNQAVSGSISGAGLFLPNTTSATVGVLELGTTPFLSNYGPAGSGNVFVGGAGNFATTGVANTAIGSVALSSITSGGTNNAFGDFALASMTTGSGNTAIGSSALQSATTGTSNVAVGGAAMYGATTASSNIAIGVSALQTETTGVGNVAVGGAALFGATTASNNTAVGPAAMQNAGTGGYNTALGGAALYNTNTGTDNTAVGNSAMSTNTAGSSNSALGVGAGRTSDDSSGTGSSNTAVGANAIFGNGSITNATAIGANAEVTESNTLVLGCIAGTNFCPASINVGIGTTTPTSPLTVNGSITIAKAGRGIVFPDGTTQTTASGGHYSTCVSNAASPPSCGCSHEDAQVSVNSGASCTASTPSGCTALSSAGCPGCTPPTPVSYGVCCVCH